MPAVSLLDFVSEDFNVTINLGDHLEPQASKTLFSKT